MDKENPLFLLSSEFHLFSFHAENKPPFPSYLLFMLKKLSIYRFCSWILSLTEPRDIYSVSGLWRGGTN